MGKPTKAGRARPYNLEYERGLLRMAEESSDPFMTHRVAVAVLRMMIREHDCKAVGGVKK